MREITEAYFIEATGRKPENDDLERCNCTKAGQVGHFSCGWNYTHNAPCFEVGPDTGEGKGEGECDKVTDSHSVPTKQPNQPLRTKEIQRVYDAGMGLANALRWVSMQEEANDIEIWVLGMINELEDMKGESK